MSKVNRFEDLIAWQKARALTKDIYRVTSGGAFGQDYGLTDQIRRAAVSIISNLAEGYERGSRADFGRFITIAKASCAELRSELYVAHDVGYLSQDQFDTLMSAALEISRVIGGLRRSITRTDSS